MNDEIAEEIRDELTGIRNALEALIDTIQNK